MKKNYKKAIQTEFRIETVFKRKDGTLYVQWKAMIIYLTVGLIKKI